MDAIAGEIGFYQPLFEPLLLREIKRAGRLTFGAVEAIRQQFCPNASFHSTLIACAKLHRKPTICLEAGKCLKNAEQAQFDSAQIELFSQRRPPSELRVLKAVPNGVARARKLGIHYHMAVPDSSAVYHAFHSSSGTDVSATENLALWRHSDGNGLVSADVTIEARRVGDTVIALVVSS